MLLFSLGQFILFINRSVSLKPEWIDISWHKVWEEREGHLAYKS